MKNTASSNNKLTKQIPVWDLPLRLFHWMLSSLVVAAIVSAKLGGNALDWHVKFGLAILSLLLFRVLWGFVGGTYARFANFLHGPHTLLAYLRGELAKPLGHNPLGALSVLAILGVLLLMAATGLFANDDVLLEAPLYPLVSKTSSDLLTYLHTQSQYLIFALVLLHIAAIIYYRLVKREDLLRAMLSGRKQVAVDVPDELAGRGGSVILAALLLAACGAGVWALISYAH